MPDEDIINSNSLKELLLKLSTEFYIFFAVIILILALCTNGLFVKTEITVIHVIIYIFFSFIIICAMYFAYHFELDKSDKEIRKIELMRKTTEEYVNGGQ